MKPVLVLLAVLAFAGCDHVTNNCSEGSYRCDASTPSKLQTCVMDTWEDNPECDVACAVLSAGEVIHTAHYTCTCLGSGAGSSCDAIP